MSMIQRLTDLVTAIGTDYKQLRVWVTGSSTGDLTGLNTTTKASIVAAINEVKAGATGSPPAATELASGVAEIASQAEMTTGTDDVRFVTPLKHTVDGNARWQAKSANLATLAGFTTSTDATLAAASDTILATQKAVKTYADGLIDANNAYVYKGVLDASTNPNYPAANAGHTYKVSVAGKLGGVAGVVVEIGDTITCIVDGSVAGNQATVGANWIVTQTNIDGALVGPAASTSGNFPAFSGATGKVISDSGVAPDTDVTMVANSNAKVPTTLAIRTFLGANFWNKTEVGAVETDLVAAYNAAKA